MDSLLRIKKYKRISEEIQLMNFSRINYLVGKNGSGKSSILNALSHLNDGVNSKRFFNEESVVELSINGSKQFIVWENKNINPNYTSHKGNLQLIIIAPDEEHSEKGANGIFKTRFKYSNIGKEQLEYINQTSKMININPIRAKRIIINDDPWDTSVGERIFLQEERKILLEHLSDGLKALNNLRFSITESVGYLKAEQISKANAIIVLIEEPENNLHPDLQKKIPHFIEEFIQSNVPELSSKFLFFITTHSPFIISAAAQFEDHKVYLLDEGSLIDLQLNNIAISEGYKGHECAWVVGQMLGSDITDLGYPDNYVILEEFSMQIILESAKERGLIKNFQFVSASGAMRVVSFSETINEIDNLNTLIKCNPYYFNKYFLIIDNYQNFSDKEIERVNKIKNKLGDRFIEMNESSLEEYYKNIDPEIFKNANEEIRKAKGKDKGVPKAKYANLIAKKIITKQDFSKLFNQELDFLLKKHS